MIPEPKYSQDTKTAFGAVITAHFSDDVEQQTKALKYLAKMVGCDLSGEIRGVMSGAPVEGKFG